MEDDYTHMYDNADLTRSKQYEEAATSGKNCKVTKSYQQPNNYLELIQNARGSSVGGGEVEYSNMKGDSLKAMKRCLIIMTLAIVLMALVTTAAFVLAVLNYKNSRSGELTDKVNQLANESQRVETELTNDINLLSIQHQQSLSSTRDNISQVVANLSTIKNYLLHYDQGRPNCGAGLWYRVAFLNMSDSSQQCPSAWRLVTTNGVRACGRPVSSGSSCPGTFYSATSEYQRVCGRVIGYQDSTPDGFHESSINNAYIDGVSITYGQPRNHIWSYAAGYTENSTSSVTSNCPCSPMKGEKPQSFVGDNYYCESGNSNDGMFGVLYNDDKLWDGKQCEGTCCTDSKSPPWFSVRLPNPTTESIEVRICGDQETNDEDTPIELLELYVQ